MPATHAARSEVRWWTYALTQPALVLDALEAVSSYWGSPPLLEALCDLVEAPLTDRAGVLALRKLKALQGLQVPMVRDAFWSALDSPQGPLRLAAVRLVRDDAEFLAAFVRLLRGDPAPLVRRECARVLSRQPAATRLGLLEALTDPAWRVRRDVVMHLTRWQREEPSLRAVFRERLGPRCSWPAVAGALRMIDACTQWAPDEPLPESSRVWSHAWDPDPAVLREQVRHLGAEERARRAMDLPTLFLMDDGQPVYAYLQDARRVALHTLCEVEDPEPLARLVRALEEPRQSNLVEWVARLDALLPPPRRARLVHGLLTRTDEPAVALCWALTRVSPDAAASGPLVGALARLAAHPEPEVRAAALRAGQDPDAVGRALRGLEDSAEAVRIAALDVLSRPASARTRAEVASKLGPPDASVAWRRAVARWCAASRGPGEEVWLRPLSEDPDAQVRVHLARGLAARASEEPALLERLARDGDRRVREAALTPERAAVLWGAPGLESSWRVLARAARLLSRPLGELAPEPPPFVAPVHTVLRSAPYASYFPGFRPPLRASWEQSPRQDSTPGERPGPSAPRLLTPEGPWVSPLGISGRYLPPEECFAEAVDAGANLLFWEPPYLTLTHFFRNCSPARRQRLVAMGGTFSADPRAIRDEAEQMLRLLRLERLGLFMIFWARSEARLADPVLEVLAALREEGKIQAFGISTHDRALAQHALRQGWGTVMVRHSAVHRGAEREVLPLAERLGRPAVVFSSLCYGMLLAPLRWQPAAQAPLPTAADCYRYSLSRPGVGLVVSAPRDLPQVREGLRVLADPTLPPEREAALLAHGARVYEESRGFSQWVRHR